jgi:RNA polymerase sigma-70 factor (ECF subfamily)
VAQDVELLRAWRDGDTQAGERLFDRVFPDLHRFFSTKVSRGADDLVQQTLLAVVEGRDRIRDDAHFRGYLFGCARRLLYRSYERKAHDLDPATTSAADLTPGVETHRIAAEDERLLLEGLRKIPLDYQVALELRFWGGLSGPNLAEALGVPLGTVRTRIRRGLIVLRECIQRLEATGEALASTCAQLDDWAQRVRENAGIDVP